MKGQGKEEKPKKDGLMHNCYYVTLLLNYFENTDNTGRPTQERGGVRPKM